MDANTRQYRRHNAVVRQLTVLLIPPLDNSNPVAYFLARVNDLFEHAVRDVDDSDMVRIKIQNQVNENDKPIGISFIRKNHLSEEVTWSVFERVSQSNSRFSALDTLDVTVQSVKMLVVFGKHAIKSIGRPLSVMAHLKNSIVEVEADENCLAHAILIPISRVDNVPNYKAYRKGRNVGRLVLNLIETTHIDLSNGAGVPELVRF